MASHTSATQIVPEHELCAVVTIGNPETARKVSKALGREVKIGDKIDLGTISVQHTSRFKTWWENFKIRRKKNPFS